MKIRRTLVKLLRVVGVMVIVCLVLLAAAFVTTVSMDLGPVLKAQAEEQGSRALQRQMRIGNLSIRLWSGTFVVEDLTIDGPTPDSPAFFTAGRISISMPWETLFDRRVVFDAIEIADWRMHVEQLPDGHTFPRLPERGAPGGESRWTITPQYVRARGGEFTYDDPLTPWKVVARNIDIVVTKPADGYAGQASFSDGTVRILDYLPFGAGMTSTFTVDGTRVVFDRIDLTTDGARTVVNGDVNLAHWPEQMYMVRSAIELPRMREIFFANDRFSLSGTGDFTGTFHLFRETLPDGATRTGRELKGAFESRLAGVDDYRFQNVRGQVRWVPEALEVTEATAGAYGGSARFEYRMAPLGNPAVPARAMFDARYAGVSLPTMMAFLQVDGIRVDGRVSGRNRLEWPLGRFAERHMTGDLQVTPPPGVSLMTRDMSMEVVDRQEAYNAATPFSPELSGEPVPIGGALTYTLTPQWIEIGRGRLSTPETYVEFEGRTAYGERSRLPFHVTSADWQASDRLLAGVVTAFGSPTGAIPIGGHGTFDGVMLQSFRAPRIEGVFTGERMRAWDVLWGSARGRAVIEDAYVDVEDVVVTHDQATIEADGRFSLGFPRRDGGEEINARIRVVDRPIVDLRHAFGLDEYAVDGLLSGEFHLFGRYQEPFGFGTMSVREGLAYGEPFDRAVAVLRFEGSGITLDNIELDKDGGRGTGAAYVGLNGTYSFNLDARQIPVESLGLAERSTLPLSGLLDLNAGGSGRFDTPRYDVRGTIQDFFIGDEGIGQVVGTLGIDDDMLTVRFEAASPRLAVSGAGRIALTEGMTAELSFNVADTSLDPYVRTFEPRLSPFTTAVASGTVRVVGELADIDNLLVDVSVDRLDLRLFDYRLLNALDPEADRLVPIRVALDRHALRIADMRLEGEGTALDISGTVSLHDERIDVRATGDANLAVLQGLFSEVRSSGRAVLSAHLEGPMRDPLVGGTFRLEDGRIRHFGLPHALETINGALQFDTGGVSLDGLSARIGGGDVQFSGRIDKDGYLPGRFDVTMNGRNMRLRFPQGMRSLVDADLLLHGTTDLATLSGDVIVRDAMYSRPFEAGLFDLGEASGGTQPAPSLQATLPLRYDVRIAALSTLQVRNSMARLVASADLQLSGTYDRPLLFGRAEVDRGEITFEGRRYLVTRGTVDFNNPTRIEPFFDVETETRVRVPGDTYNVTVRATGPADRLALEFTSDPPLAEVEVLALLFGDLAPGREMELLRYSTDITPQQQLLRERATRALTGAISSEVGRVVEQTFGVDTFQITPSLVDPHQHASGIDPAARVTIGKRLSDRVYLTYSRSVSSSTSDQIVLLEYDQTDRFSWILSRNEDRTYALDVRVRRVF